MSVSEYDAFGPWVYEIDSDHPLPRLFAPAVGDPAAYRMLLKIPRNIERRKATPDMNLYDYVLGADGESVWVWRRQEDGVERTRLAFRDISGIRLYQRLLHGVCTLYGVAGAVELPYNTVSAAVLWRFAELVRGHFPQTNAAPAGLRPDASLRETDVDIWLFNQMRDLRERGVAFTVDGYQPCRGAYPTGRRLPWTKPEEFAGTLYLHNERELFLLRSGKPEKKGEQKYSAEFTAIAWEALQGVSLEADTKHEDTLLASFHLPGASLRTETDSAASGTAMFLESLRDALAAGKA